MKRFPIVFFCVAIFLVCIACSVQTSTQSDLQAAVTATPEATATPVPTPTPTPTPEPTPTPRILVFSPNVEMSKTDSVSMILDSVSYTQNQSIDLHLTIVNDSAATWGIYSFFGSVNGWGFSFAIPDGSVTAVPSGTQGFSISAPLSPTLDEMLKISDLQNVYLTSSAFSYDGMSATFTCPLTVNENCSPEYVQEYPTFDTQVYESKTMDISLAKLDLESHTAYLYVDNRGKKEVLLTNFCPEANGYCSEDLVLNGFLPAQNGKTMLMFDLSALLEQSGMDQLKKLAVSGDWSNDLGIGYSREFTFGIPVENGDDAYLPAYDETGDVWIDTEDVKLIYRGASPSDYGFYQLELLLINKTADKPIMISPQQSLTFGDARPWLSSNVIVAPGSASIVHLDVYSDDGVPISPEEVGVQGAIHVFTTGFRKIASGKVEIAPLG